MKKLFVFLFVLLFTGCQKEPQVSPISPENALLNTLLKPLTKAPLDVPDQDLKIFNDLKSAKIIGLGEATHGTKEFFEMKHRLFKYFVENFNHRIFAFEMDYGESLIFDDYVQTGKGDLVKLMKDKMYFWTWSTVEVKNLLEWMKNYNLNKPEPDRVHIYGMDCQTFIYNVPELLKRVNSINPSIGDNLSKLLMSLPSTEGNYKGGFSDNILNAQALINDNKSLLIAKSSEKEYNIIEHLMTLISQTDAVLTNAGGNRRDTYMAANVQWLNDQTTYPLSVWAHNGHIVDEGSITGNYIMGSLLTQKYQDKYKKIGFSFADGTATARNFDNNRKLMYNTFPESVRTDYVNQLFFQANTPNFVVKMSDMFANDLLKNYFQKRNFYQIGSGFSTGYAYSNFTTLKAYNFDYLIHINTSTHSDNYWINP